MAVSLALRHLQLEGISFCVLSGRYAQALAVDAAPSAEAAAVACRLVYQGRLDGTLKPFGSLGVAFRGASPPGRTVVDELRDACVYIVTKDLKESAVENATSFLDDVESRMPEVLAVVESAGGLRRAGAGPQTDLP